MHRITKVFFLSFALIFSIAFAAGTANAVLGQTTRVSLNTAGDPLTGNGLRGQGLSADGQHVVFSSAATNLGPSGQQVYRRACASADCRLGATEPVSVRPDGVATGGFSPSISNSGRYVAFVSLATDLIADKLDTNLTADVFLRDMQEPRSTKLVSSNASGDYVSGGGVLDNNASDSHVISDDGNLVVFASSSNGLGLPDNATTQIYVKNMTTGLVTLVSTHNGAAGNGASSLPVISGDGHVVAFMSLSTNLTTPALGSANPQVYVRDLTSDTTSLESVTWDGLVLLGGQSSSPALSRSGRYLAFESTLQLDNRSDHDGSTWDVYLRDRGDATTAPTTVHVSHSDTPTFFPPLDSRSPAISADGAVVAFQSLDMGLVPGDGNGTADVFVYDRETHALSLVSRNDDDVQGNFPSTGPSLSEHGSLVLFASASTNLATPPTTNAQLYLRKLVTNQPPVLRPLGNVELTEPQPLHLAVEFTDEDSSSWTATVNYGDGAPTQHVDLGTNKTFAVDHRYAPGTYDLRIEVADDALATDGLTVHVVVHPNLPPVIPAFGKDIPRFEAEPLRLTWNFSDNDASTSWTAAVDYDDGAGKQPLALNANKTYLLEHLWEPGVYDMTVEVTDDAGATGSGVFHVVVSNMKPSVSLLSTIDLAFSRTLDTFGTFVDPGSNETYSATVNYGDGTGTQPLALGPYSSPPYVAGSFTLHHTYASARTYSVVVTVSDGRGDPGSATLIVRVGSYSYEFLDPASTFVVGRNLPVKFTVRGPDGSPYLDTTVRVDVVDDVDSVVSGPYAFGDQPSRAVTWNGDYHVNIDTRSLAPGMYWLRVQFSSPTLTGEFRLGTTGTGGAGSATKQRTLR